MINILILLQGGLHMSYKDILENAISAKNFNLNECLTIENQINENITNAFECLKHRLSMKMYKNFKSAIIRAAFFIELTNPTAETDSTKYQVRWVKILKTLNDVRFATFEQCVEICEKIVSKIAQMNDEKLNILKDYCANSIYTFELPIDYIERYKIPFHNAENIDLFINPTIERCTKVRNLITNTTLNPKAAIFKKILSQKIKVKAYQTDRAQTGEHKTNREKRWESHPENYQFAFRRDCNDVEATLILQICKFEGTDSTLVHMLQREHLLPSSFNSYKCPITGDILKYNDFEAEILNRTHGKSCFQVGHLNPLKSTGVHNAENIGWISDDGNRIQGSLSMTEVNELLIRIYSNRPELHP